MAVASSAHERDAKSQTGRPGDEERGRLRVSRGRDGLPAAAVWGHE